MKSGENRVIIGKANAFRIWRAASSVNWDCTAKELSDETGLAESTVRKICAEKGWDIVTGYTGGTKWDVVTHISNNR